MAKKHILTIEEKLQQALVPKEEQPYKIPDNWCWVKLSILFENKTDSKRKIQQKNYLSQGQYPIVDQGEALIGGYTNNQEMVLDFNQPIIIFGDHTRCVKYIDFPFVQGADGVKILKPQSHIESKFFYYNLINLINLELPSLGYRRHFSLLNKMLMPISTKSEQQRIVEKIENLFAKLDKAKDFIQATIDKFEQNKMAVLHKAFTGELTANWRKSHGIVQPIEYISLNDCGTWSGGGTPSTSHQAYWENGNILWITSKDMKVKYITSTQKMVNEYGIEHSSAKYIEKPALLFVIRSGILRNTLPVCMVQKPFTINQDLKALIPKDGIELAYIYWICKSEEFTILSTCMKNGTTVESISFDKLKDFKIPIPDIEEQREVVRILDDVITKEQHIMELATKNLAQIELLKKSILAKAFRGGLGTNDGDDGSAMELLKSILANEG